MTYVKSSKQLRPVDDATPALQSLTDDIYALDAVATPFKSVLYELSTVSGRAIRITPGFKPYGAHILNTDGATITGFKTELRGSESIEVTVTFTNSSSSANILYLIVGSLQNVKK